MCGNVCPVVKSQKPEVEREKDKDTLLHYSTGDSSSKQQGTLFQLTLAPDQSRKIGRHCWWCLGIQGIARVLLVTVIF
mgnify:CR=1 FL=1